MTAKKILNFFGIILGIAAIVFGVMFITDPPYSYSTTTSDYASFGADYYTYQYQATRDAVRNTGATANTLGNIGEELALYAGMAFILAGLFIMIYFMKSMIDCFPAKAKAIPTALPVTADVIETPVEEKMIATLDTADAPVYTPDEAPAEASEAVAVEE